MNYSCQEEYEHDLNCQGQAEAEALAEQEESELSCCGTRITDTGLCVECGEHC